MYSFRVPATSANLGIGFDCMGIAFDLFDYFEIEKSDSWILEGFESEYNNTDNLFVKAYLKALGYKGLDSDCLKVVLKANVPISRGLGSSACLIVGGIYACSIMHNNCLSKEEMLTLASEIEGHPDNVAPAIYGGLCVMHKDKMMRVDVDDRYHFGLWIPDQEVSTAMARSVLPLNYEREDVVNNVSAALFALEALKNYDSEKIVSIMDDLVHEPYRSKLIDNFIEVKEYATSKGALAFIVSGSGSTCLSISDKDMNEDEVLGFKYMNVKVNRKGAENV